MTSRLTAALRITTAVTLATLATQSHAELDSGAYLAARQAGYEGNYAAAAEYSQSALLADPQNLALMERAMTSYLGAGEVVSAAQLAQRFLDLGQENQVANIALLAQAARNEDWDAIFERIEAGHEVGPLLDGLSQAWAYVGKGELENALARFDEVSDTSGLRSFGQQHKAMALTMAGRLTEAEAIYALPPNEGLTPTRASVVAHVRILCQMGEFEQAEGIVTRAFGPDSDPEIDVIRAAIAANEVPPLMSGASTPTEAIAFAFRGLADVLQGEANEGYLLLYAQAARHIAPGDAEAHIATAHLLNALDQYDAAAQIFAQVAPENTTFFKAEIGRAEALRAAGRMDQAIEVLSQLTRSHPDLPRSYFSLGDIYRQQGDYALATNAYDSALAAYPEDATVRWWLLYSRGIAHERLDEWPEAEADFRAALALNPENASVLNYLGYSMVDREMADHYDEALDMIERAVAARPDSGAITDSLAWVYYKLGRYQEAVAPMERAAELEPNDPIVSDHLGDVYWMVGREVEAHFQWRRALSFEPEEAEADRIRRKLEIGLDAVYAEDGQAPAPAVEVANDEN